MFCIYSESFLKCLGFLKDFRDIKTSKFYILLLTESGHVYAEKYLMQITCDK